MRYILFFAAFVFLTDVHARTREDSTRSAAGNFRHWESPRFFMLQYAGNIGFLSAGAGVSNKRETYQLALLYGYAPASVAGVRIHTVTAKNVFHLYKFGVSDFTVTPYAGLGASLELGGRSFFFLPSNMPKRYYNFPKSIHVVASAGLKVRFANERWKYFRAVEVFGETTTIDAYIWYKFLSDEVKMRQILSLAAGIQLFRK